MAKANNSPILFTRRPSAEQMPQKLTIVRAGANGLTGAIILSHDVVGADLHYYGGRSRPCMPDSCEACENGQAPRWRGYLVAMSQRTNNISIVEVTAAAMPSIDTYFKTHRTLRGAKLDLTRAGRKPNGRLYASLTEAMQETSHLPKAPDLEKILTRIWDVRPETVAQATKRLKIAEQPKREADFGDEKEVG